jgi:hypothetical protein
MNTSVLTREVRRELPDSLIRLIQSSAALSEQRQESYGPGVEIYTRRPAQMWSRGAA